MELQHVERELGRLLRWGADVERLTLLSLNIRRAGMTAAADALLDQARALLEIEQRVRDVRAEVSAEVTRREAGGSAS